MTFRFLFAANLALSIPAAAQPSYESYTPKDWKLSEADAQKWVERLKKLCPPQGWMVTARGDAIELLQLVPPVVQPNSLASDSPITPWVTKHPVELYSSRITLWFGPKMSLDAYEQLVAQNSLSREEDQKLRAKYKVTGKLGPIRALESELRFQVQRQQYLNESKKLKYVSLPDFYTTDYSITLFESRRVSAHADRTPPSATDVEWNGVRQAIDQCFGNYRPPIAKSQSTPDAKKAGDQQ